MTTAARRAGGDGRAAPRITWSAVPVALALAATACSVPAPSVTPSASFAQEPLPASEPCDVEVLTESLDRRDRVEGYHFVKTERTEGSRVLNERAVVYSEGSYLAPHRVRHRVANLEGGFFASHLTFLDAVRVAEATWYLRPAGEWVGGEPTNAELWASAAWERESDGAAPLRAPLEEFALLVEGLPLLDLKPAVAPASLPGRGGCVLVTVADGGVTAAIRLDPAASRVLAWSVAFPDLRFAVELSYEVPRTGEFTPPDLADASG